MKAFPKDNLVNLWLLSLYEFSSIEWLMKEEISFSTRSYYTKHGIIW